MTATPPEGLAVEVVPSRDAGRVARRGTVAAESPLVEVTLETDLPGWATSGEEIVLWGRLADDRFRWTATVDTVDPADRLLRLREVRGGRFVERRRAPRVDAPYEVEWSALPDGPGGVGVGRDLNRLGLRFATAGVRPELGAYLVATVRIPPGAVTLFGRVVGVGADGCRVEIDHLHPESLRRLVAWEAEGLRGELAERVLEMVRDDPEPSGQPS